MVEKVILILNETRRFGDYSSATESSIIYNYVLNDNTKVTLHEDDFSSNLNIRFKEVFKLDILEYTINLKKIDNQLLMRFLKMNFRGDYISEKTDDFNLLKEIIDYLSVEFSKAAISEQIEAKIMDHFKKSLSELDTFFKNERKTLSFFKNNEFSLEDLSNNPINLKWINLDFIQNYGFNNSFRLIEFLSATQIFQEYKVKFYQKNKDYELVLFVFEGAICCGSKRVVFSS
ncbi:hypothetical protein [Flavobacterium sp. KACC 22761]|uniref:hypothetical protein n=1 Tax=Flavobacterium sp. KACC 22761 TaxID=3092665 RepID=UPI002A74C8EC|nr:hypothetical protein [Flavobacterium sp. KACC 22761]WPO79759.1 hypothetical protein SCB73_05135 [Flavobacterium sp. KACC 22761]